MGIYAKSERWLRTQPAILETYHNPPLIFVDFSYRSGLCAFGFVSDLDRKVAFDPYSGGGELKAIKLAIIHNESGTVCCDHEISVQRVNVSRRFRSRWDEKLVLEIRELLANKNLKVAYVDRRFNKAHKFVREAWNEKYKARQSNLTGNQSGESLVRIDASR